MTQDAVQILSSRGPIAAHLGASFEARPEQGHMARGVAEAMDTRSHLLVEAGTGVGKSYAYLVPAILRCMERNEKVVIATNTIALQEQLVEKDVPLLTALLCPPPASLDDPPAVRPVLVKGRGNYVSVRRLKLASQRQDRLFADAAARRSLHVIEDWAMQTRDGTLSTLPALERPGVWDKVQSDSGNCMGRKCPTYAQCFYQAARAQIEHANLFITNHALFFADLNLRAQDAGILPAYDHVVLDEGHGVEDAASDHFGVSLGEGRVQHLLTTLFQGRSNKGYLTHLTLAMGEADRVGGAVRSVEQAAGAARAFFDDLRHLIGADGREARSWIERSPAGARGADEPRSARLRGPGCVPNVLTPAMRELSLRLKGLRESVKADEDRYELNAYAIRAEQIALDAEVLVSQQMPGNAYWVEVAGGGEGPRGERVTLACAPIEVGPILRDRLFRAGCSVVVTSATLATRGVRDDEPTETAETAFAHAITRLGCEGARCLQLGSPFDFASQMEVHLGAPRAGEHARGLSPLSAAILHHVRATRGGAFVLFTSFASLNRCASELAGILANDGYPLVAQGRDGSRTAILQRFRESERGVLFGAASFWQGVDVRGQALRNVIITKLPFDPPDRPITQARGELIQSRGGNPFMEDALPRAVIKFKQGVGRLIRSASDHGRVVILDDRVRTARYGRLFLNALPAGVRISPADDEFAPDGGDPGA
ncbi:MAG: helicase C-terminal domain-containing protein [Planctomycetota bacterium]|nr:helicase C-terminal domain-containing protein [Planctomycetota bacterium]